MTSKEMWILRDDDRIKKLSEEEKESVIREIRNVGETYVFD